MKKSFFVTLILSLLLFSNTLSANSWLDLDLTERNDGSYFTLVTEEGQILTRTARILDIGDSYIASDNRRYEVVGYEDDNIIVEYKETVELPAISDIFQTAAPKSWWEKLTGFLFGSSDVEAEEWKSIGIYHTHNAESYVPTSGVDSEAQGGDILEVGRVMAESLREQGYEVHWSDNSHLPHDGQAYARSRRTVMELIKQQPATLIDIHRDATPPEVYQVEIDGKPASKVRIVVGRQNQNREATMEYAKRIKAIADEKFPGIIEGIFDARGNYNQDIGPRVILLEFGTHTIPLDLAKQSAQFFAQIIPAAAGLSSPGAAQTEDATIGSAARRSILWVLGITAAVAVGYVILNKEGLGSIKNFFSKEMGLGNRPNDENDGDGE